jgi:acyl carrier protein
MAGAPTPSGASLRERLEQFVAGKLEELGREPDGIGEDDSLIESGLFDSLALMELATWIETECGGGLDLSEVDTLERWDTMARILEFVAERRGRGGQPG